MKKIILATLALLAIMGAALAEPLTVYRFSPETGEYVGTDQAHESPMEPGVFHDPAQTTRTAPPAFAEGQIPVWQGDAWAIVEDHRGTIAYKKSDGTTKVEVTDLGPLPSDLTATPKPGEFYEWDAVSGAWVENTVAKDLAAEEIARKRGLLEDADRITLDEALRTATPQQIETFVRDKLNIDGVTDLATAKVTLRRIERALIEILTREASQYN